MSLDLVSPLLRAAIQVYNASQDVRQHQEECKRICETVQHFVGVIGETTNAHTSDTMRHRISQLTITLENMASILQDQSKRPWLVRLINCSRVESRLKTARQQLFEACTAFQLGAMTEHANLLQEIKQNFENIAKAREEDCRKEKEYFDEFMDFSDEELIQRLGVPDDHAPQAMLSLEKHVSESETGVEKVICIRSLRAFQRASNPLPITLDDYVLSEYDVDINLGRCLGRGGFASVYEGRFQGRVVAVKVLHEGIGSSELMQREVSLWKGLSHPNILKLIGYCPVGSNPFMVCELKENCDVLSYLRKYPKASRLRILYEAALGLQCVHMNSVVHGDLKGTNILVDRNGTACIADFGLSRIKLNTVSQFDGKFRPQAGTARWMSPEQLSGQPASWRSDIYSFAMTMYEVMTGAIPLHHIPDAEMYDQVFKHQTRPLWTGVDSLARGRGLTEEMWRLMEDCWAQAARHRPATSVLVERLKGLADSPPSGYDSLSSTPPNSETEVLCHPPSPPSAMYYTALSLLPSSVTQGLGLLDAVPS